MKNIYFTIRNKIKLVIHNNMLFFMVVWLYVKSKDIVIRNVLVPEGGTIAYEYNICPEPTFVTFEGKWKIECDLNRFVHLSRENYFASGKFHSSESMPDPVYNNNTNRWTMNQMVDCWYWTRKIKIIIANVSPKNTTMYNLKISKIDVLVWINIGILISYVVYIVGILASLIGFLICYIFCVIRSQRILNDRNIARVRAREEQDNRLNDIIIHRTATADSVFRLILEMRHDSEQPTADDNASIWTEDDMCDEDDGELCQVCEYKHKLRKQSCCEYKMCTGCYNKTFPKCPHCRTTLHHNTTIE